MMLKVFQHNSCLSSRIINLEVCMVLDMPFKTNFQSYFQLLCTTFLSKSHTSVAGVLRLLSFASWNRGVSRLIKYSSSYGRACNDYSLSYVCVMVRMTNLMWNCFVRRAEICVVMGSNGYQLVLMIHRGRSSIIVHMHSHTLTFWETVLDLPASWCGKVFSQSLNSQSFYGAWRCRVR